MIHVETKGGFVCDIPEENLDNMELLEELVRWKRGDKMAVIPAIDQLLGKEGKQALYDHFRDETGRVPASLVSAAALEIFQTLDGVSAGKNS